MRNTEGIDIGTTLNAVLLLDLVFHGEAVAVPPEAPAHLLAAHRLESGDDIFDGSAEQMTVVRKTRCKRRPVVEAKNLTSLSHCNTTLKHILSVPVLEDSFLEIREMLLRIDGVKMHSHGRIADGRSACMFRLFCTLKFLTK